MRYAVKRPGGAGDTRGSLVDMPVVSDLAKAHL